VKGKELIKNPVASFQAADVMKHTNDMGVVTGELGVLSYVNE
jgi:hypothetical protein